MGTSVRMLDLTYAHLVKGSEAVAVSRLDAYTAATRRVWPVNGPRELFHAWNSQRERPRFQGLSRWAVLGSNQ